MPFIHKDSPCAKATHSCSRCNRTFAKEGLIQHLEHSFKHSVPLFPESCVRCGRSFSDSKALIQHLKNNRHHLNDLHQAACTGRFQLVDQLMRNENADSPGESHLPSKSQTGFTPMHCAAFGGHFECLKIMLNWQDGRPNVTDPKDGRTPVHLAAWRGHGNCLRLLLRKGGSLHKPDRKGKTPLDLARDGSCLSIILFHLVDKYETRLQARRSQSTELDLRTVKLVWNRLHGENSFEQRFGVIPERGDEGVGDTSQVVCEVQRNTPVTEEPCSEPYEVLARGQEAVSIFNKALREGKAQVTRMQLTFIGDIGAGKTSLVRNLSGEEFMEERQETHGINTSMVEMTELDDSWHAADLNKSHVDEILSDKVCEGIKNSPRNEKEQSSRAFQLSLSDPGPTRGHRSYGIRRLPSIESAEGSSSDQSNMIPVSRVNLFGRSSSAQTAPRDIPVDQIVRKLSEASLDDDKPRKYTKIMIWDFAGHPLYQAMHHVFLNRRSFYLVVTNLAQLCNPESRDQAIEKLHFWLNSIRVHTPQTSPVFLVGTHRDQVTLEDISQAERMLYDEFVESFGQQLVRSQENSFLFAVDNTLGTEDNGAMLLKKTIEEEASRLMLMDEELPVLWLHFEEEILKRREEEGCPACVPKAFLQEMIRRNFSIVDETFESMLHFYHDSGVIILSEELLGPETQNPLINDLVVINPQYLVDVMTCLHDIPKQIDVDRQHCTKWKTLQDRGVADISFLEHVWKKFSSSATELVGILEASGMLCPISTLAGADDPEDLGEKEGEGMGTEITRYIVPIHLKEKCLKGKWERLCRKTWNGICNSDKVLIYDFLNFLPPALFSYFIVRTGAKSKASNGMKPIVAKGMAIFSFGDSFFILTEACQKYNQIKVSVRHKNGKKLHELFTILMSIMTDICQRQFKFLKFSFGPVCPNPRCPGANCDGKVLPVDTSSDESEGEVEGDSTCDEADDRHPEDGGRCHVISIDPAVWSRPLWCNATSVHQFEEIEQWFVKETVSKVPEDSPCYSMKVASCCHVIVAKAMANKWKWLGRTLGVDETTIDNIQSENETQDERSYQVIRSWLQHTKAHRATVHFLMKAIEDVGVVEAMETFDRHLADRHAEGTSKDR